MCIYKYIGQCGKPRTEWNYRLPFPCGKRLSPKHRRRSPSRTLSVIQYCHLIFAIYDLVFEQTRFPAAESRSNASKKRFAHSRMPLVLNHRQLNLSPAGLSSRHRCLILNPSQLLVTPCQFAPCPRVALV